MRERYFKPTRDFKVRGPSHLAAIDGSRRPGSQVRMDSSKAPKPRYAPGQTVEFDGSTWTISYMYRLKSDPGVWRHCLMESVGLQPEARQLATLLMLAGAGATTPRIVYDAFVHSEDVYSYFSDIYLTGDCVTLTTQQMIQKTKTLT